MRVSQFVKAKLDKLLGPEGARAASGLPIAFDEVIQREIDKGLEMFGDIPIDDISPNEAPDPDRALSEDEKNEIVTKIDRDPTLQQELRAITATRAPVQPGARSADAPPPKATMPSQPRSR